MPGPKEKTKFGVGALIGNPKNRTTTEEQVTVVPEVKEEVSTVGINDEAANTSVDMPIEEVKTSGDKPDKRSKTKKAEPEVERTHQTTVQLPVSKHKKLSILSINIDKTHKELINEAIDLLLKKYKDQV
ncbi:hypothetical protein [Bacteroides sp. 51]|uniref:hypothetical protein n=1 Tax=Bacteroides sp. 51 TaxID=2302938 RepID=UPI0013CFCE70|nr:hypothetical protein [Bacteroides sp. 51]NDV83409.1 hypothetical protein [Bacteroides sp. 51]